MKTSIINIFLVWAVLNTFSSCSDSETAHNEMNQRIQSLERKLDSLLAQRDPIQPIHGSSKKKSSKSKQLSEVVFNSTSQPTTTTKKSTSSYSSYSGRCQATTQKGSQCKRTARSNGYCWQHGG